MDVRKIQTLKKGDEVVGARVKVKVVKNKVAPPFKTAEFSILPTGVDNVGSLIDIASEKDILQKSGAFYKYEGNVLGQGMEQTKEALTNDQKLMKELTDKVFKTLNVKGGSESKKTEEIKAE
jgi:recombination protein RecA